MLKKYLNYQIANFDKLTSEKSHKSEGYLEPMLGSVRSILKYELYKSKSNKLGDLL